MTREDFIALCKYYAGEAENPYKDQIKAMWWEGEKIFVDSCTKDHELFEHLKEDYIDFKKHFKDSFNPLIPENKRVLMFFLAIWHSKWFPYDSPNMILKY